MRPLHKGKTRSKLISNSNSFSWFLFITHFFSTTSLLKKIQSLWRNQHSATTKKTAVDETCANVRSLLLKTCSAWKQSKCQTDSFLSVAAVSRVDIRISLIEKKQASVISYSNFSANFEWNLGFSKYSMDREDLCGVDVSASANLRAKLVSAVQLKSAGKESNIQCCGDYASHRFPYDSESKGCCGNKLGIQQPDLQ